MTSQVNKSLTLNGLQEVEERILVKLYPTKRRAENFARQALLFTSFCYIDTGQVDKTRIARYSDKRGSTWICSYFWTSVSSPLVSTWNWPQSRIQRPHDLSKKESNVIKFINFLCGKRCELC